MLASGAGGGVGEAGAAAAPPAERVLGLLAAATDVLLAARSPSEALSFCETAAQAVHAAGAADDDRVRVTALCSLARAARTCATPSLLVDDVVVLVQRALLDAALVRHQPGLAADLRPILQVIYHYETITSFGGLQSFLSIERAGSSGAVAPVRGGRRTFAALRVPGRRSGVAQRGHSRRRGAAAASDAAGRSAGAGAVPVPLSAAAHRRRRTGRHLAAAARPTAGRRPPGALLSFSWASLARLNIRFNSV